ncbi:NAD-dependent dehydratase [Mycolicibacterium doricum]|uniref:NAD-dependent dehydratase n=1 Tax=Mycolicibacterium doricum TaxID=126673 RepID=A0A1X1TA15_9MYCO|nr:NAD-dependent epimerase/dehydratase family protein [Mycolicibacterium doricum]MCV7266636.1 NAD-dependent epimerase/dehydratase family protein [Mycolicibacterium doricum]ORV41376.1 NAD-dependent dehydratase [Mycolicibacterium doricum]BBZ09361.1 NAD-dependent dehydratase [Mycolicibacterium doricum]
MDRVLVTGASGFIGRHLVTFLKGLGYWVRGVDYVQPRYSATDANEFLIRDLRCWDDCLDAFRDIDDVYALAADMGGMGFISSHHAEIMRNNSLINLNCIHAASENGVARYFLTSSACVYPFYDQASVDSEPLREASAYPAHPEDAYGWEKLMAERTCGYYASEFGLQSRVVRLHNIYGSYGTYDGGREKAPAALCRKVAEVNSGGKIEIWGDGEQRRSFCHVSDCVHGIHAIMRSDFADPINLGTERSVTINDLARIIIEISGKRDVELTHVPGPQGVRGRNSDNSLLREVLHWEPRVSLEDGLTETYRWIEAQVRQRQLSA